MPRNGRSRWILIVCLAGIAAVALWEAVSRKTFRPPPAPPLENPAPVRPKTPKALPAAVKKKPVVLPARAKKARTLEKVPLAKVTAPAPPARAASSSASSRPPQLPAVQAPAAAPSAAPPYEPQEWRGEDTAVTHGGQVVVRTDEQWIHFWSEHHPHEASPDVDFTQNMVIGVFAGPRPAEGFKIQITDIRTLPKTLQVDYREQTPPTGTFSVGVTVYPYDLKVIPKTRLPVKFVRLNP